VVGHGQHVEAVRSIEVDEFRQRQRAVAPPRVRVELAEQRLDLLAHAHPGCASPPGRWGDIWLRSGEETVTAPTLSATLRIMDLDGYVWITTRKLKPGSRDEFSRSWRPSDFPAGMLRAYELYSPDGNEVVGVSVWDSAESRDAYRRSEVESERRRAMAPYVLEEVSGFYVGRELKIPRD
jgi:heme-degrading monooxygenase HmoA